MSNESVKNPLEEIKVCKLHIQHAINTQLSLLDDPSVLDGLVGSWVAVVSSILGYSYISDPVDRTVEVFAQTSAERLMYELVGKRQISVIENLPKESQWVSLAALAMGKEGEEKIIPAAIAQASEYVVDHAMEEFGQSQDLLSREELWSIMQQAILEAMNQQLDSKMDFLLFVLQEEQALSSEIDLLIQELTTQGIDDKNMIISHVYEGLLETIRNHQLQKEKDKKVQNMLSWKSMFDRLPASRSGVLGAIGVGIGVFVESLIAGMSLGVLGIMTAAIFQGTPTPPSPDQREPLKPQQDPDIPYEEASKKPVTKKLLHSVMKDVDKENLRDIKKAEDNTLSRSEYHGQGKSKEQGKDKSLSK